MTTAISRRDLVKGLSAVLLGSHATPLRATAASRGLDADVCVVGSGFAGTYLALGLLAKGYSVVLVEAGGEVAAADRYGARDLFPVRQAGAVEYPVAESRTIGLGGTSHKWTGVATRFLPADFAPASHFGVGVDWPVTYADLEPYYCQAEGLLGVTSLVGGRGDAPRDCPFPHSQGTYREPVLTVLGRRLQFLPLPWASFGGSRLPVRLADVELPKLAASERCTLLPEHPALRLVTRDGDAVDHLEVATPAGGLRKLTARAYVVAAGTFESARLLLASRCSAFPTGLGNRNDLVGRRLTYHPDHVVSLSGAAPPAVPPGIHRTYSLNELFRRDGLPPCHFQLHVRPQSVEIHAQPQVDPTPDNRVTIEPATDAGVVGSRLLLHLSHSPSDVATLERAGSIQRQLALALELDPTPTSSERRFRFHPSGTCPMARDEQHGVVDGDLRVFGTKNLFVSGACVFPAAATPNPTLTVVALTLRLADHLARLLAARAREPAAAVAPSW